MDTVSLIRKKREGQSLSEREIVFLIEGYVDGEIPDYQISSFLMAVFFRGLSFEETGFLIPLEKIIILVITEPSGSANLLADKLTNVLKTSI